MQINNHKSNQLITIFLNTKTIKNKTIKLISRLFKMGIIAQANKHVHFLNPNNNKILGFNNNTKNSNNNNNHSHNHNHNHNIFKGNAKLCLILLHSYKIKNLYRKNNLKHNKKNNNWIFRSTIS